METPMFINASQNTTLEKPDIVYLQQLQEVISNAGGGQQLLTQGIVSYRAASQMGGTFFPLVT